MKYFCTSQQLSRLGDCADPRQYLSGERFWDERHAERLGERPAHLPWQPEKRSDLVTALTARGDIRRLAVVCAAGLGKTTNLRWLAKELAAGNTRQVPFFFELDDGVLPSSQLDFLQKTLPAQLRKAPGNSSLPDARLLPTLERLRAAGRITLFLDSIDQASANGLQLLHEILTTSDWCRCPVIVSARPHALFDGWDQIIGENHAAWRFVRVEPLEADDQKKLLNRDGIDRYALLPPDGRVLMANPRHIEYVLKLDPQARKVGDEEPLVLADYTLHDLRTASHLFAGAADHMVRFGMTKNAEARKLGRRNKKDQPPEVASPWQIELALNLLAALAYSMYCQPAPRARNVAVAKKEEEGHFRPNVSHVPEGAMAAFLIAVLGEVRGSGILQEAGITWEYDITHLEEDLVCLAELNAEIKYDLLDTRPHRHGDFRWYDRSLEEFFAGWWLSRYADGKHLPHLRQWLYRDPSEQTRKSLYESLWGFLVEMPLAVRKEGPWVSAVGVLLEPQAPRCCEMIYRAWPGLESSQPGANVIGAWQQEFQALLKNRGRKGKAAREIRDGFRPIEAGGCPFGADSSLHEAGTMISVQAFRMHQWAVMNEMYELFDPGHLRDRWSGEHPLAATRRKGADDRCPVVNVTFFNAWCFARWCGFRLPTELEWEHACRAGSATAWHCGDNEAQLKDFAWYGEEWEQGSTHLVGQLRPNDHGLYDMHGNVLEWCDSRYLLGASARVLRGGGWGSRGGSCRSASRVRFEPDFRYNFTGFRMAAVPDVGAK